MASPEQRDAWGERLPRSLGLWSAVAVLVGSTIGSGIFRVPAEVAAALSDPRPVLLTWVLGGLIALCGALTLAELASALPRSGGVFAYILEAFGPLPAFLFGWSELAIIRASALGAIATIVAEYLGYFFSFSTMEVRYVAAGAIVLVGFLNYRGVKLAAVVMNLTTVGKFAALAGLVALAFLAGDGSATHFQGGGSAAPLTAVATVLVAVMWTYDGWADLSFVGGEVSDPQRTLPRALIIGTVAIVAIYLAINAAYVYLVPLPEMAESPLIAATAAERIPLLGSRGAGVIAAIVVLSCFGTLNGSMLTGPRIFFALADRGLFFKGIARVSPRHHSPSAAIWLATGLGVLYVLFNDFRALAEQFVLGIWPFYALAVAAVFVLRRRRPDLERPYQAWGYPLTPIIFLVASVGMVANALITDTRNTMVTFGVVLAGIPVYWAWRKWGRRAGEGGVVRGER